MKEKVPAPPVVVEEPEKGIQQETEPADSGTQGKVDIGKRSPEGVATV